MAVKKWSVYVSILALPLIGGVAARLLRVIIAFMLHDQGVSVFDITLLSASFMLARAFFSPVIGRMADRGTERITIIIVGFVGMSIDAYLYTIIPYPWMFALRIMDGMYGAMVWPTMQAMVHFASPAKIKAKMMSFYFMMGTIGMAIGYLIYSALMGNLMYSVMVVIITYSLGIILTMPLKNVKEKKRINRGESGNLHRSFYPLTFLFGMYASLGNEVLLFYLNLVMGISKVDATLILSVASILALGGSILLGHVSDSKGFSASLIILIVLVPASAMLIAINHIYSVLVGVIIFFVVGRGFMPISRSYTAAQGKKIGSALGLVNLSSNLGSVIAPIIGGAIMDSFLHEQYFIFTAVGMFFMIIAFAIAGVILIFMRATDLRTSHT